MALGYGVPLPVAALWACVRSRRMSLPAPQGMGMIDRGS
jgi:hypothetical protein